MLTFATAKKVFHTLKIMIKDGSRLGISLWLEISRDVWGKNVAFLKICKKEG